LGGIFDPDSAEIDFSTKELSGNKGTQLFTLTFTSRMIKHKQRAMARGHHPSRLKPDDRLELIVT